MSIMQRRGSSRVSSFAVVMSLIVWGPLAAFNGSGAAQEVALSKGCLPRMERVSVPRFPRRRSQEARFRRSRTAASDEWAAALELM